MFKTVLIKILTMQPSSYQTLIIDLQAREKNNEIRDTGYMVNICKGHMW